MPTLIKLTALAVVLGYAVQHLISCTEQRAYQAAAILCAEQPERPGCEKFSTAAGE